MTQIVKKVSAPYSIQAVNNGPTLFNVGNTLTNNAEVTIFGNLTVKGTQVVIESTTATVADNTLTINSGVLSANTNLAGIVVDQMDRTFAPSILWSEADQRWLLDNGNGPEFITTQLGTSFLSRVQDDLDPHLGGNLNVNGFNVTSTDTIILAATNHTQVDSTLQLKNVTATPPDALVDYNMVYASDVAGGGTGLYVNNRSMTSHQELVSKRRAIVYSLIF